MANQVASQLALSAHVAKAAQVAQATAQNLNNQVLNNQQPVFPHPIAIAPLATSSPMNTNNNNTPLTSKAASNSLDSATTPPCVNGRPATSGPAAGFFGSHTGSPPPVAVPHSGKRYDVTECATVTRRMSGILIYNCSWAVTFTRGTLCGWC